jgi:hypothetical protein
MAGLEKPLGRLGSSAEEARSAPACLQSGMQRDFATQRGSRARQFQIRQLDPT